MDYYQFTIEYKCGSAVGHYLRHNGNIELTNNCVNNYEYFEESHLYINKIISATINYS